REGLQYECIACAACIDACDSIMDKMNYPRGLVRFTTEHSLQNKSTRVLRPRMLVYGTLLLILTVSLAASMATRTPLRIDVMRDRNSLYRELPNNFVENIYTLKLINQSETPRSFALAVDGVAGLALDGVDDEITIPGGEVLTLPVRVRAARDSASGIATIRFVVTATDDASVTAVQDSRFIGPTP
ncbi:MAG: FixG Ig-like domain-containing protein, partial [Woeseiaceae bacterium]